MWRWERARRCGRSEAILTFTDLWVHKMAGIVEELFHFRLGHPDLFAVVCILDSLNQNLTSELVVVLEEIRGVERRRGQQIRATVVVASVTEEIRSRESAA